MQFFPPCSLCFDITMCLQLEMIRDVPHRYSSSPPTLRTILFSRFAFVYLFHRTDHDQCVSLQIEWLDRFRQPHYWVKRGHASVRVVRTCEICLSNCKSFSIFPSRLCAYTGRPVLVARRNMRSSRFDSQRLRQHMPSLFRTHIRPDYGMYGQ